MGSWVVERGEMDFQTLRQPYNKVQANIPRCASCLDSLTKLTACAVCSWVALNLLDLFTEIKSNSSTSGGVKSVLLLGRAKMSKISIGLFKHFCCILAVTSECFLALLQKLALPFRLLQVQYQWVLPCSLY